MDVNNLPEDVPGRQRIQSKDIQNHSLAHQVVPGYIAPEIQGEDTFTAWSVV